MLITITGDTKGIGRAISAQLGNLGHQVAGFSRSNGFDIGSKIVRD